MADHAARHDAQGAQCPTHVATIRGRRHPATTHTLIDSATRASDPTDDHLDRVRSATTIGLPAPKAARPKPTAPQPVPAAHRAAVQACIRLLAAAGPLDLDTRCPRTAGHADSETGQPLTATDLTAALTALGAQPARDGRWRPPPGAAALDRYRAIVTIAGAGRDLTGPR